MEERFRFQQLRFSLKQQMYFNCALNRNPRQTVRLTHPRLHCYCILATYSSPHFRWRGHSVPFGSWRLWDTFVSWRELEPQKGQWQFGTLDRIVELSQIHHVGLVLTLALTTVGIGEAIGAIDISTGKCC